MRVKSYLVAGRQCFGQNNTRVPITVEFSVKTSGVGRKHRESRCLHAVIEVLDDELHQILPTSELAQVVERGKDLEFLQQPMGMHR